MSDCIKGLFNIVQKEIYLEDPQAMGALEHLKMHFEKLQAKNERLTTDLIVYGDNLHICNVKLKEQAEQIQRLKKAWDSAYKQAMENGQAYHEMKYHLFSAIYRIDTVFSSPEVSADIMSFWNDDLVKECEEYLRTEQENKE